MLQCIYLQAECRLHISFDNLAGLSVTFASKGQPYVMTLIRRFIAEEEGATLAEYVLLVALIGIVAITAMRFLGGTSANKLRSAGGNVQNGN